MWNSRKWYNNREACEEGGFEWYEKSLSEIINVTYPECGRTGFSRVNQLGNSMDSTVSAFSEELGAPDGLNANRYMWKIPKIPEAMVGDYFGSDDDETGIVDAYASCAIRLRCKFPLVLMVLLFIPHRIRVFVHRQHQHVRFSIMAKGCSTDWASLARKNGDSRK